MVGVSAGMYYRSKISQIYSQTLQAQATTQIPLTLDIPSIHVHAAIESVGLDSHHQMDVPKHTQDVAWYSLGSQPGQQGNAVIDGHVDTQTGAPAVFAQLNKVKPGDKIDVTEKQNITHEFVVTSVQDLPTATFPSNRVFGATSSSQLNLITCDGTWDTNTNTYSKRLVVFSSLVK